jgi:hypothetical protein
MNALLLILNFFLVLTPTDDFTIRTDRFLQKHVQNGNLNYAAIAQESKELQFLVKQINEIDYQKLAKNEQKAFLINAYNVLVISEIIKNYPINSPQDIAGFFSTKNSFLSHKKIALDELEKGIIFAQFADPRLHFALICGAKGCPKLPNFAFKASILEQQLDQITKINLDNLDFLRIKNGKIELSQIFDWYGADFKAKNRTIIGFINQYKSQKLPENANFSFYQYDWTLNDALLQDIKSALNLQQFTPSALIPRGRWEYKAFNNFYTQNQSFDGGFKRQNEGFRSNYNTFLNQFLFGFKPRYNLGFDLWVKTVSRSFEGEPYRRTAIAGFGPKIKFVPFRKLPQISVQSTFLLPLAQDLTGRKSGKPYLSADAALWITQCFWDKPLSRKFLLFTQVSSWLTFGANPSDRYLATPLTVFLSYLPNTRTTLYVQNEVWPTWGWQGVSSMFVQQGVGGKFQLIPGLLELESSATVFTIGKNGGAGQTLNVGVRLIR